MPGPRLRKALVHFQDPRLPVAPDQHGWVTQPGYCVTQGTIAQRPGPEAVPASSSVGSRNYMIQGLLVGSFSSTKAYKD